MNKQPTIRRPLTHGFLGVMFAAAIGTATSVQAGPLDNTVARIQSSVNALHTGIARTAGKLDDLRQTVKDLPEAQRKIILAKFKAMNDPAKRHEKVEEMVNTMQEIAEPVQQFVGQVMTKMQGKLAQRMRSELVDGQPGPIGAGFGLLYDLMNPMTQALLAGDQNNAGTRSVSTNTSTHTGHYNRDVWSDPQTFDDCIMHKSTGTDTSVADPRCMIRLIAKPSGSWICDAADYAFDLANVALPSDVTSFWTKYPGIAIPEVLKGVCLIAKGMGSIRNGTQVDDELRFKIESNLMGDKPLALFQLPGQFGGKLEVVERVVHDTIQNAKDAGFNMGDAETEYAAGGGSFSNKQYGAAYTHFAKAYKAIVNAN